MKQLLFLLLFPCFAMAQYQGNANQKITLGEQTTADGLVYRGVASIDTVTATSKITRANKQDTSAFLLLDTVTNLLWHYKTGSNAWTQAGGGVSVSSFSAGTTGLTPSTATTGAVTLGGTLAVANGGTGSPTQNFVDLTTTQSIGGIKTFTSAANFNSTLTTGGKITSTLGNNTVVFENTSATTGWLGFFRAVNAGGNFQLALENVDGGTRAIGTLPYSVVVGSYSENGALHLATDNNVRLTVLAGGNVGIGTASPQSGYRLHVVDSVYVGGNVSASAYTTRSDYDLKDEIQNINYGLNEVMQMQPVKYTYKSNGSTQLGFIAQDLGVITPEVVSFEDKMSVYYNALIPILTKAIQEQQALIKALEQRILNLENK